MPYTHSSPSPPGSWLGMRISKHGTCIPLSSFGISERPTPLSTQESGNLVLSSRHVPRLVLGLEAVVKASKSPQAIDGFTLNFEDEN